MKKILAGFFAVCLLAVFVNAQPMGQGSKKYPGKADMEGMREHFKNKMKENKALHEEYANAKTDAEKKAVEAKINQKVAEETDAEIAMFQKRLDDSEKKLKEAKKKLSEKKKDKKNINQKKAEMIKEGNFSKFGKERKCDKAECSEGKECGCDKGERKSFKGDFKGPKDGQRKGGPRSKMNSKAPEVKVENK
ncbi:hypothetical protein Emin_0183 [Elusimicrobium minutum Pei191]|uniref:Uncharacterized protein n=1 Tax=Elusimicrobium minutum (strain Pei191) TaxID=445932 RepID=B2KBR0_ELUMP|nr:hypothetical protein [Elusimicrobium minutum]ACC97747.1 hypothetical protein Emin_0183 [Elusimicrobium minutum Pei191]